jgi:C_GCAxxG_C_C family probable redox protein
MIEMEETIDKALTHFKEGYACSETILLSFADSNNIKSEIIPKIASGFGGGIARTGSVCGALTGAIMAIGLKYGRSNANDKEAYELCLKKSSKCCKKFEKEFGSIFCFDLIDCDLSTSKGRHNYRKWGLKEEKCSNYVKRAMEIVLSLTEE